VESYYHKREPGLKSGTLYWRIYHLKNQNIIYPVKRGAYALVQKRAYQPEIEKNIIRLKNLVEESYKEIQYNIWTTRWLNEFTVHQAMNELILIETEKEAMETVFNRLRDAGQKNVFIDPDEKTMRQYVSEEKEAIIISPMISRAPVENINDVSVPSLEKILVDLFCEETIFYAFKGNELKNIFRHALKYYVINFSTLVHYATRRRRDQQIKVFLKTNFETEVKGIIK
jgi:hypothetical protein